MAQSCHSTAVGMSQILARALVVETASFQCRLYAERLIAKGKRCISHVHIDYSFDNTSGLFVSSASTFLHHLSLLNKFLRLK